MEVDTTISRRAFVGSLAAFLGLAYADPKSLIPSNGLLPLDDLTRTLPYFITGQQQYQPEYLATRHLYTTGRGLMFEGVQIIHRPNGKWESVACGKRGVYVRHEYCFMFMATDYDSEQVPELLDKWRQRAIDELVKKPIADAKKMGYRGYKRLKMNGEDFALGVCL